MKHNLSNFPKEKDETDYLLTYNREVKRWFSGFHDELNEKLKWLSGMERVLMSGEDFIRLIKEILGE